MEFYDLNNPFKKIGWMPKNLFSFSHTRMLNETTHGENKDIRALIVHLSPCTHIYNATMIMFSIL